MKLNMRFPDGKPKALTFSYDDGVYQDLRLISIFNQYGLKGTFNLNSGSFGQMPGDRKSGRMTKEDVVSAYKDSGHEVAVHAFTHPHLEQLPNDQATKEILADRENLEELFHTIVRGGAYPFGSYSDEVVDILKNCGIRYFRTTASTEQFTIPIDWLRLPATCHHKNKRLMELAQEFVTDSPDLKEGWRREPWLFYVWGHSYEFDQNTKDNNWDLIERFAEFVSGKEDVWYATNIEIYDYVTAFRSLEISLSEKIIHNPTAHTIFFEYETEKHQINPGATVCFA
ncbi:MAG: polysaccharide deacetylase family protein [Eubacteriales bacterium]